jgi:hypothetical protein
MKIIFSEPCLLTATVFLNTISISKSLKVYGDLSYGTNEVESKGIPQLKVSEYQVNLA